MMMTLQEISTKPHEVHLLLRNLQLLTLELPQYNPPKDISTRNNNPISISETKIERLTV